MEVVLRVLPTVLLVAYSQVMVKWRTTHFPIGDVPLQGIAKFVAYLTDPFILSAYLAGLIGSFAWLFIVARLPLGLAFPIYQGLTFLIVLAASAWMLDEPLTAPKLIGITLILAGIVVGAQD